MNTWYEIKYLQSLLFTVLVETVFLFVSVRFVFKIKRSSVNNKMIVLGWIICSSVTLPYVWFIMPVFIKNYQLFIIIAEVFAVIAESIIIFFLLRVPLKKSFLISLICNVASFVLGELIKFILK